MSAFAIWQTQFVNMSLKVASNGPSVYVFMLLQKNGKCHFGTATASISRRGGVSGLFDLCSQSLSDLVSCLVSPLPPVTGHGNWPFGGQPANKWTNEPHNSSISCHRSGRKREWTLDCLSPDFRAIARGPCHFFVPHFLLAHPKKWSLPTIAVPQSNPESSCLTKTLKSALCLTQNIQDIVMGDGTVFVFHHTGVVSSVRGHDALHHQAPVLVPQLTKKDPTE